MSKLIDYLGMAIMYVCLGLDTWGYMNLRERLIFLAKVTVYAIALFAAVVAIGVVLCA